MNLRQTLAALFSPTRQLIGTESPVVRQGGALGGQEWVVPRAECQYRSVDLASVPARQRQAAARLAVVRHQPTPAASTHVAMLGDRAHLWIWADPPAEVAAGERRWIPETRLLGQAEADGPRLLRLARGFEGQVWEGGQLLQSQWWPQAPQAGEWQRFLRAGGLEPSGDMPGAIAPAWGQPWGEARQGLLPGGAAARERLAWTTLAVLVALGLGWEAAGLLRWSMAAQQVNARLDALRTELAPVLAARERAEQAQAELARLHGLQSSTSDYVLMAHVLEPLPEGTRLRGWLREDDKLKVSVSSSETDPRRFVTAYATSATLSDASATPGGGGMHLAFSLATSDRTGDPVQ